MSGEEIQKLVGGFATGTLTEAEQQALFAAALEDQELFDALAKEQALRDVLQDGAARRELIAALGPVRPAFVARIEQWLQRPVVIAAAGSLAAVIIGAGLALRQASREPRPVIMAEAPAPRLEPKMFQAPAIVPKAKPAVRLPKPPELARGNVPGDPAVLPPPPAPPAAPPPPETVMVTAQAAPMPAAPRPIAQSAPPQAMGSFAAAGRSAPLLKKMAKTAAALALNYGLLLRGSDGADSTVPAGALLHVGDSVRIQFEAPGDGSISLFRVPGHTEAMAGMTVSKGRTYTFPDDGIQSTGAAKVELLLVFSPSGAHGASIAMQHITLEFH